MRKAFLFLMAFALSAAIPADSRAQDPARELQLPTQKFVLENGLTVLISEMPSSPSVAVYGYVKAGSVTEGKWLGSGLSHFLEHMLFKGTERRGVGEVSREIQALGGTVNASTSFDYTVYTLQVPAGAEVQALDILADMLMNSRFDPEEIEKEREVIYSEIRMHNDRPERAHSEAVFRTVFTRHPYRLPVIGYEELLRQVDQPVFKEYYKSHYIPNNMILSVAGNVKADVILPEIKKAFGDFARRAYVARAADPEPEQISPRRHVEEFPTELTRLSLSYAGVQLLDPDMQALDVLSIILGKGESSRLYQDVFKKRRLVRSISTYNYTPTDRGMFEVDATLDEDQVPAAIAAIKENIRQVINAGVKPKELDKAKRQVLGDFIFSLQSAGQMAMATAMDEAIAGDYRFAEKYVAGIAAVTVEDIRRVAQRYLKDERLSVVILKPKGERTDAAAPTAGAGAIEEFKLDNGLRLLLKKDAALPMVTVRLAMKGALMEEPPELNGISGLTAMLWTKGTASRSAEQIAEAVESRAASLSGSSGRNSFGLGLEVLAQDLPFALDLLEDLVKNPAFSEAEMLKEKDKLRTSILRLNDNISFLTSRAMRQDLFAGHPLSRDETGTMESIDRITREDIRVFYARLRDPANMVLAVFGDIDVEKMKQELARRLGSLTASGFTSADHTLPRLDKPVEKTQRLEKEQAMIMVGFQGADIASSDRAGLDVLSEILGSPFSGRIFTRVRDEFGNAYSLGGGYTPALSGGILYFYALTTDDAIETVRDRIYAIIDEIRATPVPEQELADIKQYISGSYLMGLETLGSQAMNSALDDLYGLGFDYSARYPELIRSVTAADVQRLAGKYLHPAGRVTVLSRPQKSETNP